MHGENHFCLSCTSKEIHTVQVGVLQPRVKRDKGEVYFYPRKLFYFTAVTQRHFSIIGVAFLVPVPPVEVTRVIDFQTVYFYEKSNPFVCGVKRLYSNAIKLQRLVRVNGKTAFF